MLRFALRQWLGLAAAGALAASAFGPMISTQLRDGRWHHAFVAGEPRYALLACAVLAIGGALSRHVWIDALAGAGALFVSGSLFLLTHQRLIDTHMAGWARTGWAFPLAAVAGI